MKFKNRPKNKKKGFLAVRNGTGQVRSMLKRQPTQAKPVEGGPGEHLQTLLFLEKNLLHRTCQCPSQDECIHFWSVTQMACETTCFLTHQEIMKKRIPPDQIPAAISKMIVDYRRSGSALKKTLETVASNLPLKKRRRLIRQLERYQNEHRWVENKFLTAVAYVKGVFDHDWVVSEKLEAVEQQVKHLRWQTGREFYAKTYLENPHFVENELAFSPRLKKVSAAEGTSHR